MVECDCADVVKLLLDNLFNEVWVYPVLTHGGVELANALQEDFNCHPLLWVTGASLPQACRFGPQNTLDGLVLQHACHYTRDTNRGKIHFMWFCYGYDIYYIKSDYVSSPIRGCSISSMHLMSWR